MRNNVLTLPAHQRVSRDVVGSSSYVYRDASGAPVSASLLRSDIVVNPKSADGWREPSAYSATFLQGAFALGSSSAHNPKTPWYIYRGEGLFPFNSFSPVIPPFDAHKLRMLLPGRMARTEADVAAFTALANKKGNLLESLAEARSSLQGITDNAKTLSRFASAAIRKDWAAAARSLGLVPKSRRARRARDRTVAAGGSLGSAWLNYNFGIKPIIDDMVFALIILNQDREIRLKGSGRARITPEITSHSTLVGGAYSTGRWTLSYKRSVLRVAKTSLWYSVRTSQLARFNELGAYSVPATAWALVPMSFVVDWVLPVSSILHAWTADVGLSYRGGTHTQMVEVRDSGISLSPHVDPNEIVEGHLDVTPGATRNMIMDRQVYKTPPYPTSLYVKDPLSVWTAVTSLALLASIIKSTKGQ